MRWTRGVVTICFSGALATMLAAPIYGDQFDIQGQFDTTNNSTMGVPPPLYNGSFLGTYTVAGLPASSGSTVDLTSWEVYLFDATGHLVTTLETGNGIGKVVGGSGSDVLLFEDALWVANSVTELRGDRFILDFSSTFDGTGTEIGGVANIGGKLPETTSGIASGEGTVSEPSSVLVLLAVTGVALLAKRRTFLAMF